MRPTDSARAIYDADAEGVSSLDVVREKLEEVLATPGGRLAHISVPIREALELLESVEGEQQRRCTVICIRPPKALQCVLRRDHDGACATHATPTESGGA